MTKKQRRQVRAYNRAVEALHRARSVEPMSAVQAKWIDHCYVQLECTERNKADFKHLLAS